MKTEQLPATELGYREGSSDKVYRAGVEADGTGFVVNFAYGRRGSSLATGTKTQEPVSMDEAVAIYEKLIRSKLAKGYKPTGGASAGIGMNIAEERKDTGLRAMLLNPITEDGAEPYLRDPDWCAQEKFDGKRLLVRKTDAGIVAANRHGIATGFPTAIVNRLVRVEGDFVIDGELVGDRFYAFDILENMGHDWRSYVYHYRLVALKALLEELEFGPVIVAETFRDDEKGVAVARLKAENKEGVVFKNLEAPWAAGRPASGGNALKCKFWATCSCVVARVNARRSVEIALGGVNMGNVTIPPNQAIPAAGQVVEIRYLYVNGPGGSLYQPVYLGTRDDVPVSDCTVEKQRLKYKAGED
jgi:bifunctional non-homologous end joining protein LigD